MQVDDLPSIDPNVDYTQILPIQQKRMIAFINHLVMNTVNFLNNFAQSCESRLMEFENKIQRVEASLLILESQLSSISGLDKENSPPPVDDTIRDENKKEEQTPMDLPKVNEEVPPEKTEEYVNNDGPTAAHDSRYQRFFKMVQFGVPPPAVKLKMQAEGIDPDILDTPNAVIPGFATQASNNGEDSDASNSS